MKRNFSKVFFTITAMMTVSIGAVISAPLAKADTFELTQISSAQPQSGNQKASSVAAVVEDTEVYSGLTTESDSVQDLPRGTTVVILDRVSSDDTTWYKVVGDYWGQGWVEGRYLNLIPQNQTSKLNPGSVVVVNSDANARVFSGPGTNYVVRAFLAEGTEKLVLDSVTRGDTTWYEIGDQSRVEGWIEGDYLSLRSQSPSDK